ncbi:MAG: hypothetical protein A3H35_20690 [Betaproteobacteria bacterium RIFCSPLOWO2_02_FULL_62_17]|nr:MAG: hypothetical protein A3H35_20690 [Betaproteobacteria bacterium RIFCSPLOWO2_02_FULL_62_17]
MSSVFFELVRHPETPCTSVHHVHARISRVPGDSLEVKHVFEGGLDRMILPAPQPPRIGARLWQHTCCEIFIARPRLPGYHEFNFSPSGEWAAYAFARYREPVPLAAEPLDPQIATRSEPDSFELGAKIRLDRLSSGHCNTTLTIGLSAVIEDRDGALSYWALRHPPGKPDFHHADAFMLTLE